MILFNDSFLNFNKWKISGDVTEPNPITSKKHHRTGLRSCQFQIPSGGGRKDYQRQYISPKNHDGGHYWWREGSEAYFGFSHFLDSSFPNPSNSWYDLTQWWNTAGGSPPVELGIPAGSTHFWIDGGWGSPKGHLWSGQDLGPVVKGQWIDWIVRIKFSVDKNVGNVDVWRNGNQVVSNWHPIAGTLYPGGDSYIETGIYRASEQDSATMWQDTWTIGTTKAEVDQANKPMPYPAV